MDECHSSNASSLNIRDGIPSGPHDLFGFSELSLFCMSSSTIARLDMMEVVLWDSFGISSVDSVVKTLRNCFCRIFALVSSSNFNELGSAAISSKGATPVFVLSFLRECDQNLFGFFLASAAIPFSNSFLTFFSSFFTLLLAFVKVFLASAESSVCLLDIHRRWDFFLLL